MKALISKAVLLGAVLAAGIFALTPAAMAGHNHDRMYRVTVINATRGQPLSPSVIATHTEAFQLFELGPVPMMGDDDYPQYFGLAAVAETGKPFLLLDAVSAADGVWEAVALPPVLQPGESNSVEISASGRAKYLSAAAMLGKTNDAFYAVRGVELPKGMHDSVHVFANAYDAGSEANAESADTVGTGDGDDGESGAGINNGNGEGYIHVHAGIHGIGGMDGLDAPTYDWRNPVAELIIERIR